MTFKEELKKLKIEHRLEEPFSYHTTYNIGGPVKYFIIAKTREDLINSVILARKYKLDCFFLGSGSNLLVNDQGFNGLVIKNLCSELKLNGEIIEVSSGHLLSSLILKAIKHNLVGLEFAAGIPGTVGGAIYGNAGAYGKSISDFLTQVEILNQKNQLKVLSKKEMNFSYRHSSFKQSEDLIIKAFIKLTIGDGQKSLEEIKEIIKQRNQKHPPLPSAGSTFKNVELTSEIEGVLIKKNIIIPKSFQEFKKIPSGYLIEQLGLKGKKIGQIQVSEKHANYLVNLGGGTADEVVQLISFIKQQVRDRLGIQLEEEIIYVGF
jgi:UDP-N-acetylmuramate dehydrogenase